VCVGVASELEMQRRDCMAVNANWKYSEGQECNAVKVDIDQWDRMSPVDRYQYLRACVLQRNDGVNDRLYGLRSIDAGSDGRFFREYSLHTHSVDLTVQQMVNEGMLQFEWEAKGYMSHEDMLANDPWYEDYEEEYDEEEEVADAQA
jgi:hypothetical protein